MASAAEPPTRLVCRFAMCVLGLLLAGAGSGGGGGLLLAHTRDEALARPTAPPLA